MKNKRTIVRFSLEIEQLFLYNLVIATKGRHTIIEALANPNDYKTNRTYKDTLFRRLFGDERSKNNTMSLYNALGGHCEDPDDLVFITVEGVIYMGRKNDVSFLVDGELILWGHQTKRNPNMPLRGLVYLAHLYTKYLDLYGLSEYSSRRIELPSPQYYVFYAGPANAPDIETLRLSDMFCGSPEGACAELVATVLNVNEGHNSELLEACETLAGYAHFIALARAFATKGYPREEAVHYAVLQCIHEGVLEDFFRQHRAEVIALFLEEWDEEKYRELLRREAEEDGFAVGKEQGLKLGLEQGMQQGMELGEAKQRDVFLARAAEQVRQGSIGLSDAARIFGFAEDEISSRL